MAGKDQAQNTGVPRMANHDIRLLVLGGESNVEAEGASNVYYASWKELEGGKPSK